MKKVILTIVAFALLSFSSYAQSTFNYQGVARNSNGTALSGQNLSIQIAVLDGSATGTELYKETHSTTTNSYGLYTLSIGGGTTVSGTFAGINWGTADRYIKVEIDPTGGTNYTDMGTTKLQSVPYALYALNGTPGATGATGAQGNTGADGKSAYQVWLDNGNTGTQAAFIASLKGATGAQGNTGAVGATGPTGAQGDSAYQVWLAQGNTGSEQDFLNRMKGSWMVQGTTNKADDNTDAIYQIGSVAIGKNQAVNGVALDVVGTVRGGVLNTTVAATIGANSFAMGYQNIASGDYATALGVRSEASGEGSFATGGYPDNGAYYKGGTASGKASTAMGREATASGDYSTAMGYGTTASGSNSTAMGSSTKASGYASIAVGANTVAEAIYSTAMGYNTRAKGSYSTAMGERTKANGSYSTAMGSSTIADGAYSTAMGKGTSATGYSSTAMGDGTSASSYYSTAMGNGTSASGYSSTAMGRNTTAAGNESTTIGTNITLTANATGSIFLADASTTSVTSKSVANRFYGRFDNGYYLYTNSAATLGVSISPGASSWSTISDETKKENFKTANGSYFLESIKKMKLGSWNYIGQDKKDFRHYGPMAQEFYKYFGNDGIGTVGNDTSIASADIDGVMMIAIKALAEENEVLKKQNKEIQAQITELKTLVEKMSKKK